MRSNGRHLGGVSRGESFYTKLKQNGLVINPTNGPTLQALTSGRIKLALVQSSAGIGATFGPSGDKSLAVRYLNPVTLLPSAIGIDANASATERKETEKFVNFVLSPAGQHVMQTGDPYGDSLYYPVINGVNPLPELPNDGDHHLVGTVADVAFRGRGYEHAIDIAGHGRLTGVFAPFRAERGETVGLRLDPAGCHVFPAVAAQQAAAAAARPAAKVQLSDVGPEFVRPTQRL